VFSRIRDHEEIAERGEDPVAVLKARKTGTYEDEDGNIIRAGENQPEGSEGAEGFDEEAMIEGKNACLSFCMHLRCDKWEDGKCRGWCAKRCSIVAPSLHGPYSQCAA
jgi:hypothetical protein